MNTSSTPYLRHLAFASLAVISLVASPLHAETAPAEKPTATKNQKPYLTVENHGWSEEGELVLCVRIHAAQKDLALGDSDANGNTQSFSLSSSQLIDLYSKQKIAAQTSLPGKPFYGPNTLVTALSPNGWIQLGVSFPRPPTPPMGKNGTPENYKFELRVPGGITPLTFTIPYQAPTQ